MDAVFAQSLFVDLKHVSMANMQKAKNSGREQILFHRTMSVIKKDLLTTPRTCILVFPWLTVEAAHYQKQTLFFVLFLRRARVTQALNITLVRQPLSPKNLLDRID